MVAVSSHHPLLISTAVVSYLSTCTINNIIFVIQYLICWNNLKRSNGNEGNDLAALERAPDAELARKAPT